MPEVAAHALSGAAPTESETRHLPHGTANYAVSPVFIVGSSCADASVLAGALRKVGYFGYEEGHLLDVLSPVVRLIREYFSKNRLDLEREAMSTVDIGELIKAVLQVFKEFQLKAIPCEPWYDSTPGADMIDAIDLVRQAWPEAAFIFAKRRAIEDISSRLQKFAEVAFEDHCAAWAEEVGLWRRVRDKVLRKLEVDQYDLTHRPARVAEQLGLLVGLNHEQIATLSGELMGGQSERTGRAKGVPSLETAGWTAEQIEAFSAICSAEMAAYGYTVDKRYRTPEPDGRSMAS